MASGTQGYTKTFSGDFTSYVAGKVISAARNAKQEKENQKKAEELGIEVPAEEKKGLFKRALGYEFGGRKFDRTVGPFMKGMSNEQSAANSKFSDQFSYTKALKKGKKGTGGGNKPSTTGQSTTKKSPGRGGRFTLTKGFGELTLGLERINNRVAALVSIANKQIGATYKISGGLAGIKNILQEQTNLQKDAIDDAKTAGRENALEQNKIMSGSDAPTSTYDKTPGSDEFDNNGGLSPGGGGSGVPEGDGGGSGILDMIDTIDDLNDLRKKRKGGGRRFRGTRTRPRTGKSFNPFNRGPAGAAPKPGGMPKPGLKLPKLPGLPKGVRGGPAILAPLLAGFEFAGRKSEGQTNVQAGVGTAGSVAGGLAGGWAGAQGGAAAGAAIGALFGGVGAVPGALIGGALGGLAGGIGGSMLGGGVADKVTGVGENRKAEGGILPLSSRFATGMTQDAKGKGEKLGIDEISTLPMKAVGGAILAVAGGFIDALGPIGAVVAPVIKQEISPLARVFGMPASLVKFGGIGGAAMQADPNAKREGLGFLKDFMDKALEKIGVKKKEEKKSASSSGSGASAGTGGSNSGGDTSGSGSGDGSSGSGDAGSASPSQPGMRPMTGDELAAKTVKDTKITTTQGARGSTKAVVAGGQPGLVPVKDAELGGSTDYYHDMLGQLYKVNQETQKLVRVSQEEIAAGVHQDLGRGLLSGGQKKYFFRKPDKNVVLSTLTSAPVDSVELGSRKVVKMVSARGASVKQLKAPTDADRKKLGIDQIKAPYGAASAPVPQIQAASGVTVTSNSGKENKRLAAGQVYSYKSLNPHHSDEGKNRVYKGQSIGFPKDYGMGVSPNYMPSGPNGQVPLPVSGKVLLKEWDKATGYGRTVIVETSLGKMQFSHLSKFGKFKEGDQLSAGTVIGVQGGSGNSGENSYAEHLHLNASKKGHEAFVNFITSGKPITGATDDTDSPGNEDAGNTGDSEPEDPMQAFQQNFTNALAAADKFRTAINTDPAATATASAPPAAGATPANTKPGAQVPPATPGTKPGTPAKPQQVASAAAPGQNTFVPIPMGPKASPGAGSFHAVAFDTGTAGDLRPQLASYIG